MQADVEGMGGGSRAQARRPAVAPNGLRRCRLQAGVRTLSVRLGPKRVFWACIAILEAAYAGELSPPAGVCAGGGCSTINEPDAAPGSGSAGAHPSALPLPADQGMRSHQRQPLLTSPFSRAPAARLPHRRHRGGLAVGAGVEPGRHHRRPRGAGRASAVARVPHRPVQPQGHQQGVHVLLGPVLCGVRAPAALPLRGAPAAGDRAAPGCLLPRRRLLL